MQLTERVYLVGSGGMGFNLTDRLDCHVYLVDGGDELALIDAGAGRGVPQILDNVRAAGFEPANIRHIILTHAHGDHAGGGAAMRTALGDNVRVYLHRESADFIREGNETAISLDVGRKVGIYPPDYALDPCPVDVELGEGTTIRIGDRELSVLETPGHCSGHASFLMQSNGRRHFFAGDLVFFRGHILLQNIYDCVLQQHIDSLQKAVTLDVDVLLPGHANVVLNEGQQHIDMAVDHLEHGLIPPNLVYSRR